MVVPGIEHPDGTDIGAPRGSSVAVPGDTLLIYGRSRELSALERRRADHAGEIGRRHAVAEQQRVREKEDEAAAMRSPGTKGACPDSANGGLTQVMAGPENTP